MNIREEFEKLVEQRKMFMGDIDYNTNPIILEMVKLMTQDIPTTINFLKNDCTEEQFIWLSEIFDEIIAQTKSTELVETLLKICDKFPEADKQYNIHYFIESAAEYIE